VNDAAHTEAFWKSLDELVANAEIVIDRPRHSPHPRYDDLVYPVDYGYLAGTTASDGGGIDIWVGSDPAKQVAGVICTIDLLKRDMEIKILLACTDSETDIIVDFFERTRMGHLLIRRSSKL
jgi:inorganic pyrophosphatase